MVDMRIIEHKVTVYRDSAGVNHSTLLAAEQAQTRIIVGNLVKQSDCPLRDQHTIVDWIMDHRHELRAILTAPCTTVEG